ncbi:hypothetical protein [Desulfobacula sp.]|uniref:hypothetical protein n=1 Tax=Desulfobacula sp. TaxID=2593537 RepID=UPI0025C2CFB3|nr:hypothetical protein [Desulfobacula sp.]
MHMTIWRLSTNGLYILLKFFGRYGIECLINNLCEKAQQFARQLKENGFIVSNDVVFNHVLISCDNEELTCAVLGNIQSNGICWCGGSSWNNKTVIRISVCSWATTAKDVTLSVEAFVEARTQALAEL